MLFYSSWLQIINLTMECTKKMHFGYDFLEEEKPFVIGQIVEIQAVVVCTVLTCVESVLGPRSLTVFVVVVVVAVSIWSER